MADNSSKIINPLKYHPCDTPRGCTYYDTEYLTDYQQINLNQLKIATIKSDERYLRMHPEIRGFVALITRFIFRQQPRRDIPYMIKQFFDRPRVDIERELDEYIKMRQPVEPEFAHGEEEEEDFITDDYEKFIETMGTSLEEPSQSVQKSIAEKEKDKDEPSEFIRDLLITQVRTFPSSEVIRKEPVVKSASDAIQPALSSNVLLSLESSMFMNIHPLPTRRSTAKSRVSIISFKGEDDIERKLSVDIKNKKKLHQMSLEQERKSDPKKEGSVKLNLSANEYHHHVEDEVETEGERKKEGEGEGAGEGKGKNKGKDKDEGPGEVVEGNAAGEVEEGKSVGQGEGKGETIKETVGEDEGKGEGENDEESEAEKKAVGEKERGEEVDTEREREAEREAEKEKKREDEPEKNKGGEGEAEEEKRGDDGSGGENKVEEE